MPTPDEYNKVFIIKSNLPVSAAACLPFGKTGSFRAKGTRFQVGIRITAQLIALERPSHGRAKPRAARSASVAALTARYKSTPRART